MSINVCINQGYLGGLSIEPQRITITKDQTINYVISVDTRETLPELDGEFRIESEYAETGDFEYIFDVQEKTDYSIKLNKNGFNFRLTSGNARINFKLVVKGFFNPYLAALVVDAITSGYGNSTAELKIDPEFEIVQADNFSDYPVEIDIPKDLVKPEPAKKPELKKIIDDFSVINEYNYYLKEFEQTSLREESLLNINMNYSSFDIRRYFSDKNFSKPESKILMHPHVYTKEFYPKFDKQKFLFPMFVDIKFTCDETKTQLTSFLEKIGMLDYFCYFYIFKLQNKNIDILTLKNKIQNEIIGDSDSQIKSRYIGKLPNIKNYSSNSFQKTILLKILDKQFQTLESIYKNQVLMYKVSKLKAGSIVNEQYFVNKFDDKELSYFDTQLKYDTEYEYKVSKIEALNDGTLSDTLIQDYQIKIKIIDSPPLPPDLTYIPFKGVDNQIMINFNPSIGKYADYPVLIKETDKTIFNKIMDNSFYNRVHQSENKIEFEADDFFGTFELYRLENPPKNYEDFKNAYYLETNYTSLMDDIMPNKKYYYISRLRDIHGNISNPTKPIEIEMVNENGTIFLLKKEYSFGEETRVLSKNMNSFMQIKPAKQHLQINKEKSYDINPNAKSANQINLVLGDKDISVWNKQFLMRVTSKQTGKKMDIKFKFSYSNPK